MLCYGNKSLFNSTKLNSTEMLNYVNIKFNILFY